MIMKLPPVFLHCRWSWLFCRHLEHCWPNILIGIIRAILFFCALFQCYCSQSVVQLWLGFAKWRRQNLKRTLPACFLQVKGWKRGSWGQGKKKRKKRRRRNTGRTETEKSNFSYHTNYRNIQEPVSAESISSHSPISFSCFPSLTVAYALFLSSLFFVYFILWSQWDYCWWGTSCRSFPSVRECSLLHHQGSCKIDSLRPACGLSTAVFDCFFYRLYNSLQPPQTSDFIH